MMRRWTCPSAAVLAVWLAVPGAAGADGAQSKASARKPKVVYEEDFEHGVPAGWKGCEETIEALPKGSHGAVVAVPGENVVSADAWVNGYFEIRDDLFVNYWARFENPQWYQFFIFCKARGPKAEDMTLYEAKPPAPRDSNWRLVSLPMSAFRATMGAHKGKPPRAGQVCWRYFWAFQKRDLGFAVDRIWVTRGGPAREEPPPPDRNAAPQSVQSGLGKTWPFQPRRDRFSPDALLDLRPLNERFAGEHGWLRIDADGDFVRGDGVKIRFWAVNTNVGRTKPWRPRPRWEKREPDLNHFARWLAKRGVNMVRCHAHLNPDLKANPKAKLTDVNRAECEWIWRTVAAMKKEGIYTTVSPYWANTMQSNDKLWGTDWKGMHHGLLFFDERLQRAYKEWLRVLFTTPRPEFGGRTLAQEPALAVFQIQNEDSLLFWTFNRLQGGPRRRLGAKFAAWVKQKYGSYEAAFRAWSGQRLPGDNPDHDVLDFVNIWNLTRDARRKGRKDTPRCHDQVAFLTETMYRFNRMIADYVHNDLGCPVLVNAGNWKTADPVLLNDAERYSYTACDVLAVNRYFGGIHQGRHRGWAVVKGDRFVSDSVLTSNPLGFPLNLKHAAGHPMLVTESAWVFPNEYAAEGPFLVAVYGALTGFDGFYWFAAGTDEWTPPRSANGYLPSMAKWICLTPDMAGLFPAAALVYRKGLIQTGTPVVTEHRSLEDMWTLKTPLIVEQSGFDPNRDRGEPSRASGAGSRIDPFAWFVGPVRVKYASDATKSQVKIPADAVARRAGGCVVRSNTGEMTLDTSLGACTVDAPKVQGVAAHFERQHEFRLSDVVIRCGNRFGSILIVSMDDAPLRQSHRILVQVGMPCRPTGWRVRPARIRTKTGMQKGWQIVDYGRAPWQVECPDVSIAVRNRTVAKATALDPNGEALHDVSLDRTPDGFVRFRFPEKGVLYVLLQ